MLSLSILIIFDIFYYIQLKKQIKEDPKYNKIYYSKKKKTRKKENPNIKILKKLIILNISIIIIWLTISLIINYILIKNYDKSLNLGLLKYNVIKTNNLQLIDDEEDKYYVYGYKTIKEDITDKRAYYYILEDGTEITKNLNTGIILKISNKNYEATGNLIYDSFLKKFFFQFYSYQYKTVYANEDKIFLIEINQNS